MGTKNRAAGSKNLTSTDVTDAAPDSPARRITLAESLALQIGDSARCWQSIYAIALAEANGEPPDGDEVVSKFRLLGITDPVDMQSRYSTIVGSMRSRIEDLAILAKEKALIVERERRRSRLQELRKFVPNEIQRLEGLKKTAESDFHITCTDLSQIGEARNRLINNVPPFIAEHRATLNSVLSQCNVALGSIIRGIRDITSIKELCEQFASEGREMLARGETTLLWDEAPPGFRSREDKVREAAAQFGLAFDVSGIAPEPGIDQHPDFHNRRLRLAGLPEHHESCARECDRLIGILEGRKPSAEAAVAQAQRDLDTLNTEAERWGAETAEYLAERAAAENAERERFEARERELQETRQHNQVPIQPGLNVPGLTVRDDAIAERMRQQVAESDGTERWG